jgi:hypothetical protein
MEYDPSKDTKGGAGGAEITCRVRIAHPFATVVLPVRRTVLRRAGRRLRMTRIYTFCRCGIGSTFDGIWFAYLSVSASEVSDGILTGLRTTERKSISL